jgi:hypothetical protein
MKFLLDSIVNTAATLNTPPARSQAPARAAKHAASAELTRQFLPALGISVLVRLQRKAITH